MQSYTSLNVPQILTGSTKKTPFVISFFNFYYRKQELRDDQIPTPVDSYRARQLLSASLLWDSAPSLFFPKRRLLVIIDLEMVTVKKKTVCPSSPPQKKKFFLKINKTLINRRTLHFVLNGVSSVPKNNYVCNTFIFQTDTFTHSLF